MAPLADFVAKLREESPDEIPDFDPLDGGTKAQVLFLLEKPGPMTSTKPGKREGSGFISRDNDDPTAEAIFRFMQQANIHRTATLLWNTVPGWNGTRKVTGPELRDGISSIDSLLSLLPELRSIVLVGRKAQRATKRLRAKGLPVFSSAHPSPIVRATARAAWEQIPQAWEEAFRSS